MKVVSIAFLTLIATAGYLAAQGPVEPALATRSVDGGVLYAAHCEVCHGRNATGDGAMAAALKTKVPDLTLLARRNKGVFPLDRVQVVIDGTGTAALSHGTREMPVWGPVFSQDMGERDLSKLRIFNLARYLEKLQK